MPAGWPRKLPISPIALTSARSWFDCAAISSSSAPLLKNKAKLASDWISCSRNSIGRLTRFCRNPPKSPSKMPPWPLRLRLRNFANKCRMLNELTQTHDANTAAMTAPHGMLIVVSSPSGGGKGTLIDRVLKIVDGVSYSVSYTTRAPRGSEQNGREYFFVSTAEFEEMIRREEFLEWANVYGHLYGTHREEVERERAAGSDIILEIDVQGA